MHPVIESAGAAAVLPDWARCGSRRREHGVRVGDLLLSWAIELDLPEAERVRWRATGVLHDALKDAPLAELHGIVGEEWPDPVVHAPACADRLAADGVEDVSLLAAIRYHPVGHPDLDDLGEFLILADYLEPGRSGGGGKRGRLRELLPDGRHEVLTAVVCQRLRRLLDKNRPLMSCSVDFWNRLVGR
jgi:HD superfamily phosphohydrolase YqeK